MGNLGTTLISNERDRQVTEKGFSTEHDLEYEKGTLVDVALTYLDIEGKTSELFVDWPWEEEEYKPKSTIYNLVRAGALIAAEIDCLCYDITTVCLKPNWWEARNSSGSSGYGNTELEAIAELLEKDGK